MIYVSSIFVGFYFDTTNNKGWHKTLINTKGKKEVPLNSFDQDMIRNADLGTKNMQHYSYHKPHTKAAEKLTRQVRFCKLRSLSILPLQTAEIPARKHFHFPYRSTWNLFDSKKTNPATPYNLVYARLHFVEPCFSSQNEVRCAIDTGFSEESDNIVFTVVMWDNIQLCKVV
jgi:hypothetical protein